jgi:hypothetical protein
MNPKPRIYKNWYGNLPWVFRAGIDTYTFPSWDDAMKFAGWYLQPEVTG